MLGFLALSLGPVAADTADEACRKSLMAAGVNFAPTGQPGTTSECVVQNPVQLTAIKTASGLVDLPDRPIVNCPFALQFSDYIATHLQALALRHMHNAATSVSTGPGFDCRERRGDTVVKLSEHAKGNAVDITTIKFGPKSEVLVKDAASETASGFVFLRELRAAACVAFTTVLGPGTNAAHAEHFHVDLVQRKAGYRICE